MRIGFRAARLTLAIGVMLSGQAWAGPQDARQDCEASPALPAEFAAWPKRSEVEAGVDRSTIPASRVTAGQAVMARLKPASTLRYLVQPGKAAPPESFGGMFTLTIPRSGIYRVALGSGGWVDLVQDGETIKSSAHGHGPACSGIRKIVDFRLQPGDYILQIAGAAVAELPIMVITRP